MNIDELIAHLTKLKECGYGDYTAKVCYTTGNYCAATGFSINVANKEVKIY